MKKKLLILSLLGVLMMGYAGQLMAQVTVGLGSAPQKGALLDVKDQDATISGGATATTGGVLLPRVELIKRTELLPFFSASDVGTSDYEFLQKPAHAGLIVFNLLANPSEALKVGLNIWNGQEWQALSIEKLESIAVLNCQSIALAGTYKALQPFNSGNYIDMTLDVTRAGTYTISAKPEVENGYAFHASGELAVGLHQIRVYGSGTPSVPTEAPDPGNNIKISVNGVESSCTLEIPIEKAIVPNFALVCGGLAPKGMYELNKVVGDEHYVDVTLNYTADAVGAPYSLNTLEVDGLSFSAIGTITDPSLSQTVRMYAKGTPTSLADKNFIITTNSLQPGGCQFTVTMSSANYLIDDSSVKVMGTYFKDITVTADNYIEVKLIADASALYSEYSLTTETIDGLKFTATGTILSTSQVVKMQAVGAATTYTNKVFTITSNSTNPAVTTPQATVKVANPSYALNCATLTVSGVYKLAPVTATNYVEVTLTASATAVGTQYILETNVVDGLSFRAEGTISATSQNVKLMASGTPTNYNTKDFTLTSNSSDANVSCNFSVRMSYPAMKIGAIGSGIYNAGSSTSGANRLIRANFGNNPAEHKVLVEGLTLTDLGGSFGAAINRAINEKYDVFISAFGPTISQAEANSLAQYEAQGGVVLSFFEVLASADDLVGTMLGVPVTNAYSGPAGTRYKLLTPDPAIDGIFGNASNYYWGEDASTTQAIHGLNATQVIPYSNGTSGGYTAFRAINKKFVFFGDGGFFSWLSSGPTGSAYPFYLVGGTTPAIYTNSWGTGTGGPIANSVIFGNLIDWALRTAANAKQP